MRVRRDAVVSSLVGAVEFDEYGGGPSSAEELDASGLVALLLSRRTFLSMVSLLLGLDIVMSMG